jgi:hypothetical protein
LTIVAHSGSSTPLRRGCFIFAALRGGPIAPPYPNDDGRVLNLLPTWVADAAIRKKILVDNPARLYGFAPIAG